MATKVIHTYPNQQGRMKTVLDKMHWNFSDLGKVLGVSSTAARKIALGPDEIVGTNKTTKEPIMGTHLRLEHAHKISDLSGFNVGWLTKGEEPMMKADGHKISEPDVVYTAEPGVTSDSMVQQRFHEAIQEYMTHNSIHGYQEASDRLHLNRDHMSAVRNGHKPLSITQLVNCVHYGNINANYIVAGKGPVLSIGQRDNSAELLDLRRQVEELKRDKANLQRLLDAIDGNQVKEKRA